MFNSKYLVYVGFVWFFYQTQVAFTPVETTAVKTNISQRIYDDATHKEAMPFDVQNLRLFYGKTNTTKCAFKGSKSTPIFSDFQSWDQPFLKPTSTYFFPSKHSQRLLIFPFHFFT